MMREKKSQEGTEEEGPRTSVMVAANMSWTAPSVYFNKISSLAFFYLKSYILVRFIMVLQQNNK